MPATANDAFGTLLVLLDSVGKPYQKVIQQVSKYKLDLNKKSMSSGKITVHRGKTSKEVSFVIFGMYHTASKMFRWNPDILPLMKEHFDKYDISDMFGERKHFDRLVSPDVVVGDLEASVPYLVALYNPAFNLVRINGDDVNFYGIIKLDLENPDTWNKWLGALEFFRNYLLTGTHGPPKPKPKARKPSRARKPSKKTSRARKPSKKR